MTTSELHYLNCHSKKLESWPKLRLLIHLLFTLWPKSFKCDHYMKKDCNYIEYQAFLNIQYLMYCFTAYYVTVSCAYYVSGQKCKVVNCTGVIKSHTLYAAWKLKWHVWLKRWSRKGNMKSKSIMTHDKFMENRWVQSYWDNLTNKNYFNAKNHRHFEFIKSNVTIIK